MSKKNILFLILIFFISLAAFYKIASERFYESEVKFTITKRVFTKIKIGLRKFHSDCNRYPDNVEGLSSLKKANNCYSPNSDMIEAIFKDGQGNLIIYNSQDKDEFTIKSSDGLSFSDANL